MYINRTCLFGILTEDPQLKEERSTNYTEFNIETKQVSKGKYGERIELHKQFPIVATGKAASKIAENLKKGSSIYIEGHLDLEEDPYILVDYYQFGPKPKMVGQEIL